MKRYDLIIGIDTGVKTGIAVWDMKWKMLTMVETVKIHRAMELVKLFTIDNVIKVRVEDARQRKWYGNSGREKLQGAGSVKRDAVVWEDYLTDLKVDFEMVAPKNNSTKMDAEMFKKVTGYVGKTSEHGRDAGLLVFGY